MKKLHTASIALFGLLVPLLAVQAVHAAKPAPTPVPLAAEQPTRSGTIDLLKLDKGLVVIDDGEFRVSNKTVVHGRTGGSLHSLRKGMQIRFAYLPGPVNSEITEIWISQ